VIEVNETENAIFFNGNKIDVFLKWSKSVPMTERHNPPNVRTDRDVMYDKEMPKGPAVFQECDSCLVEKMD
jgi:hypothetical protein